MARLPLFITIAALLGAFITGCETTETVTTAALPAPNFAGPNIKPPPYTPQVIAAVPSKPTKIAPAQPSANVPASWIPIASAEQRDWMWIVIHHSATPTGGAAAFDKEHREIRKWNGLGYDFVIGNGTDTPDGCIEVGYRWPIQAQGAHAYTVDERFNMHGIGICMVGNFDNGPPSPRQLASLARLAAYLADTYHIKQTDIIGHRDTKQTDCPGKYTNIPAIRQMIAARRTTMTAAAPPPAAGTELMQSASR